MEHQILLVASYCRYHLSSIFVANLCGSYENSIGRLRARTEKFVARSYPKCLSEWNKLEPELRCAPSVPFKERVLMDNLPPPFLAESVCGVHDPIVLFYLTSDLV